MFSEDFEQNSGLFETLSIKEKIILGVVGIILIGLGFFTGQMYFHDEAEVVIESAEDVEASHIYVDIGGAVKNPGVYKLSENARITDLIRESGGLVEDAATEWVSKNLNLASNLKDAQKIYVPFFWDIKNGEKTELNVVMTDVDVEGVGNTKVAGESEVSRESGSDKINVNTASQTELESLKGIGKVYSQRIIEFRPYENADGLAEKAQVPKSTIDKIQDLIIF